MWEAVEFALAVTLPNALLLIFGWLLQRSGQIDGHFAHQAAKLVFHYGLPMLLFVQLSREEIHYAEQLDLLAAGVVTTLVLFVLAESYAWKYVSDVRDKGVFVQGVFRSNMGIAGLALVQNAYGDAGVAAGAVYLGVITVLYNVLAVITLSRSTNTGETWGKRVGQLLKNVVRNPLIVAIVAALLLQQWEWKVPALMLQTGAYVAQIAIPLALICSGATFDMRSLWNTSDISLHASVGRLVLAPLVAVAVGWGFGFSGVAMGVLFLMTATPATASGYIMAKAMGANDVAAANIVGITTFVGMVSAALGIAGLRGMGWM